MYIMTSSLPMNAYNKLLLYMQNKWTSLLYASHNGHLGVVKLLLEKGANPNLRSEVKFNR